MTLHRVKRQNIKIQNTFFTITWARILLFVSFIYKRQVKWSNTMITDFSSSKIAQVKVSSFLGLVKDKSRQDFTESEIEAFAL